MSLHEVSTEDLEAARTDLDHQIAALRERKLAISRELEGRFPEPPPQDRPAAQVAMPGFVESESAVPSLNEPKPEPEAPLPELRRRWWK